MGSDGSKFNNELGTQAKGRGRDVPAVIDELAKLAIRFSVIEANPCVGILPREHR